jgi:hypothetical protein
MQQHGMLLPPLVNSIPVNNKAPSAIPPTPVKVMADMIIPADRTPVKWRSGDSVPNKKSTMARSSAVPGEEYQQRR